MVFVEIFFLLGTVTLPLMGIRPLTAQFTLSDLFYFVALFCLIVYGLTRRDSMSSWMPLRPFWLPAILILVGGIFSSINAVNPTDSILATVKTVFVYSLWMSMGIVLARRGNVRKILIAFIIGAVFAAAVAIFDSRTGLNLGPAIFKLTRNWSPPDPAIYNYSKRYPGPTPHPNILAQLVVTAMPIVLLWLLKTIKTKQWLWSFLLGISFILLSWADYLTGSVAGMVAGIFSMIVIIIIILARVIPWGVFYPLLFVGLAIVLMSFTSFGPGQSIWQSISSFTAQNNNITRALSVTGPGRMNLDSQAWLLIIKSPFFGYGMDQGTAGGVTEAQLVTSGSVHNVLIRMWLAGGLLSFGGLFIIYIISVRLSLSKLVNFWKKHEKSFMEAGLSISILSWILIDMVQPSFFQRFTWLTVCLLYGLCMPDFTLNKPIV